MQQRLILVTDTKELFWDVAGVRYQLNATSTQADWNEANEKSPAFIQNKPEIPRFITDL